MARRAHRGWVGTVCLALAGCGGAEALAPAPPGAPVAPRPNSSGELDVDPHHPTLLAEPALATRIAASPHALFRFVALPFAHAVCRRFADRLDRLPVVELHGDPHVEQYAVSALGRGLTDFDDASVGPSVVDLTRMATSLRLAARELGGVDALGDEAVAAFFAGYLEGVRGAPLPAALPPFAARLVSRFPRDRAGFLDGASKAMVALRAEQEQPVRDDLARYAALAGGDRPASFFGIKALGRTRVGLGSALTDKYLLRIEGRGPEAGDDVVVEIKAVAQVGVVGCLRGLPEGAADARARQEASAASSVDLLPSRLLPASRYWVNEWMASYVEARIRDLGPRDLVDLGRELGLDLGREHLVDPPGEEPAPAPAALADGVTLEAVSLESRALARETVASWERFRAHHHGVTP